MAEQGSGFSPALLAAQQHLNSLRQKQRAKRIALGLPVVTDQRGRLILPPHDTISISLSEKYIDADHLGWESAPLTAVLRTAQSRRQKIQARAEAKNVSWIASLAPESVAKQGEATTFHPPFPLKKTIKLYPDVALGMLRQGQVAAGRVWLLLRYLDEKGCGKVSLEEARKQLTGKHASLRFCSWRQLRNLLLTGEGAFWTRQSDYIWLRSVAKVAATLGVRQLTTAPVTLPASILTQSIGTIRAHFYATFHSSRNKKTETGKQRSKPIARATIEEITRVGPSTQRLYEKRAHVQKQPNFALSVRATSESEEEHAWRFGQALFRFTDQLGKQGKSGVMYLAYQLPNSYSGPHRQDAQGRRKRINQELADLFLQGMTGNDQKKVERNKGNRPQRFYGSGRLAAQAYNRSAGQDVYWRSHNQSSNSKRRCYQLWHSLPGGV